jgi:ATP-dependent Clp protease protease subunit
MPSPPSPIPIIPSWEEPEPTQRDSDVAGRLLEQRVIMIGGRLDHPLANRVAAQLLLLDKRDSWLIELHIACPESDLDASLALADAVDLVRSPVHVIVRGTLGGPAVAVLCAAQERAAHRNATLVMSLPTSSAEGTAGQLRVQAEQYEHMVARLQELVARTTGRPRSEVESDLRTGRVLSADEALDYGLLSRLL